MKKSIISLFLITLLFTGCSAFNSSNQDTTASNTDMNNSENSSNTQNTTDSSNNDSKEDSTKVKSNDSSKKDNSSNKKIINEVKNYILNGQDNKPEASKLNWSKSFLNNVDLENLYNKYISNGGKSDSVEKFAEYITKNAPIQSNWKQLFEKDFSTTYNEKIVKIEPLEGDLYQVYVLIEEKPVPYVVVNSRTGYFHG